METAAWKLFQICDEENKGFIVKRDMQKLQDETGLTEDQLETVFNTLDSTGIGYLTFDQFLDGFRQYTMVALSKEDVNDSNGPADELSDTVRLIKETNILKTSGDELEFICDQMRDGNPCELSQWEVFLRDLKEDLQTYKQTYMKLERMMKDKEYQHQNYVRKIFEEIESQLKQDKETGPYEEMVKLKYHEEIKKLKLELLAKDELLQKLSKECKELQNDLLKVQKKEEKTNGINNALISQQDQYELELENERLKQDQFYALLKNIKRRFSLEKCHYFNEGFNLAKKIINLQEEGLIHQLQMIQNMQEILKNSNEDRDVELEYNKSP